MTQLEFQHVLVTNVQIADEQTKTVDGEEQTALTTSTHYIVTLALTPEQSERFVFASEFGHVWLSQEPASVSDDGTRLVTLGNAYLGGEVMAEVILGADMPAELIADVSSALADMGISVRQPPQLPLRRSTLPAARSSSSCRPRAARARPSSPATSQWSWREQFPGQVAAVDLDVQFGDLGSSLGLRPEHTLAHLARSSSIDATTTKVFLTPYERNLYVLCGAPTPEEADDVTPDHVSAVLTMLANDFAFVVVDTPAGLDERTLAAMECATDLLLVSSLDVSSIRSLRKVVDTLDKLGVTTPRHFVLNRADAKVGIDVNDAAAAVGLPVAGTIPSSREVPLAMNLGSPVVVTEPKSNVAKQFQQLAQLFAPVVETAPKRRWRR